MNLQTLTVISFVFLFTSCDGFIHVQGTAYDKETTKSIEGVQATLVFKNKDTALNVHWEYDSLDYDKRKFYRKNGIKDDYTYSSDSGNRLGKLVPALSNNRGHFDIGTLLVPGIKKYMNYKIIFTKQGYNSYIMDANSFTLDSLNIYLQKSTNN